MVAVCSASIVQSEPAVSLFEARLSSLSLEELSQARGSNQNGYTGSFSCKELAGYAVCAATGSDPCNVCQSATYSDVGTAQGGGYDSGFANKGDCGKIMNGSCAGAVTARFCDTDAAGGGATMNNCTKPPSGPIAQPAQVIE